MSGFPVRARGVTVRSYLARESGVAAVEFVLVATVIFLMFFAMIDFGFLLNAKLVLSSAAREGARRAAVDGGASVKAYERIREQLELGRIEAENVEINISPQRAPYGATVRVRLSYDYPIMIPMVRAVVGSRVRLTSETISRSEKVR